MGVISVGGTERVLDEFSQMVSSGNGSTHGSVDYAVA